MKTLAIAAAAASLLSFPAKADEYQAMEQFAQSICGDIPSGNLSKTTIRGAVQANAGAFAKIVSGNANVDASTVTQIYDGIPLDKLPDNIPTVAMCKLELIKVLIARETKQVPTDLFEKVKLGSTDIGYIDSRLGTASSSSKNVNNYDQNKYKWTVLHSGAAGVTGQFQHFAPNKVLGLMVERKSLELDSGTNAVEIDGFSDFSRRRTAVWVN